MKTKSNFRKGSRIQRVLAAALLLLPLAARAGGVVTTCTEAALRAAMAGGGVVTFACDGTITLAATITNVSDTVLDGSGHQVTLSGGGRVQVLYVTTNLTLIRLAVSNGYAGSNSPPGGGIYNAGTLTLRDCVVTGNRTWSGANGTSGGGGGDGGGIWSSGNLTATGCTFSGNATGNGGDGAWAHDRGGSGGPGGSGGAIWSMGYCALTNCTLAGNFTGSGGSGGNAVMYGGAGGAGGAGAGICSRSSLDLLDCTIAANQAGNYGLPGWASQGPVGDPGLPGAGGVANKGGTVRLLNTIVAANLIIPPPPILWPPDVSGVFLSLGYNLIGTTNGNDGFSSPGDLVGSVHFPLDPKLGPLTSNGGPTLTMALLPGSPAIDAGDTAAAPATDQRGFPRPAGAAADIGVFEYGSVMPTIAVSLSGETVNVLASGNAGSSCRLLSSTDLSSWVPIATNQIGSNGTFLFSDNFAPGAVCRFYRLVMP